MLVEIYLVFKHVYLHTYILIYTNTQAILLQTLYELLCSSFVLKFHK